MLLVNDLNHPLLPESDKFNQPDVRYIIPAAAAFMLTFNRGGLLPIEGVYTLLDQAINIFVLVVAPLVFVKDIFPRILNRNFNHAIPIITLFCWVSCVVFLGSPREYWPPLTAAVTIALSILICFQISPPEIRQVRHCVLFITVIFCIYTLIYGRTTLTLLFSGSVNVRIGEEFEAGNLIAYPRIMYMLVITCLVSLLIEKRKWVKIGATVIMVLPILIAFGTGGRGALFGFVVSMLIFLLGIKKNKKFFTAGIVIVIMFIIGYVVIEKMFPLMAWRIFDLENTDRTDVWKTLLNIDNFSLFGQGVSEYYPHNIFIEFAINYGVVGLSLFLWLLSMSFIVAWQYYRKTHDIEVLWVICLLVLQVTAQQFSLDIFTGTLWATIALALGLSNNAEDCGTFDYKLIQGHDT